LAYAESSQVRRPPNPKCEMEGEAAYS
jgi:hypothetical protein